MCGVPRRRTKRTPPGDAIRGRWAHLGPRVIGYQGQTDKGHPPSPLPTSIYYASSVPENIRVLWGEIGGSSVPEFSFENDEESPDIHFPSSGKMGA